MRGAWCIPSSLLAKNYRVCRIMLGNRRMRKTRISKTHLLAVVGAAMFITLVRVCPDSLDTSQPFNLSLAAYLHCITRNPNGVVVVSC